MSYYSNGYIAILQMAN